MNVRQIDEHIVKWLSDYAKSSGVNGFVVGVSGGVDSALTSCLCASTQLETHLLELPIHQVKSQSKRAYNHMKSLKEAYSNVKMNQRDLTLIFDTLVSTLNLSKNDNNDNVGFQMDPRTRHKTQEHGIKHFLDQSSK